MGNKTILPPGFRFHPTDVELVSYYLKRKVMGKIFQFDAISEVDLYKFSPWDLPDKSFLGSKDLEWYFFCPRDKKYPKGTRANRSTHNGYWKTTGQDRTISLNSRNVGMKKTLVFHTGKPPRGERTNWVMYEYRLIDEKIPPAVEKEAYVLCKIFKKSGMGPKIGEQYGAPFNEDEWEDYDCTDIDVAFPLFANPPQVAPPESSNPPLLASNNTIIHEPIATRSAATGDVVTGDAIGDVCELDGIQLDELAVLLMDPADSPHNLDNVYNEAIVDGNAEGIYQELSDLVNSIPDNTGDYGNYVQPVMSELGNENFLELNDIFVPGNGPFDWSLMQDNYGGFPQYPSENVGGFVNSQGHNGPFTELDHVVNMSNYQVGNFGSVYPKFM